MHRAKGDRLLRANVVHVCDNVNVHVIKHCSVLVMLMQKMHLCVDYLS